MPSITEQNNENPGSPAAIKFFSIEHLAESIVGKAESEIQSIKDNLHRSYYHKLRMADDNIKILNYLFHKKIHPQNDNSLVRDELCQNENFSIFALYLGACREFHFNRSYIIDKIWELDKFYTAFNAFVPLLIADVNYLCNNIQFDKWLHFIVNDCMVFTCNKGSKESYVHIPLDKMDLIFKLRGNSYTLKVLLDSEGKMLSRDSKILGSFEHKVFYDGSEPKESVENERTKLNSEIVQKLDIMLKLLKK